ncbi:MAG: NAD(P)-binding protein [Gloeobacteraceae cyanobacterium ES-bin-144]|nr:NAD(P)-binding protein [Verrucomicrobiales bacterium]
MKQAITIAGGGLAGLSLAVALRQRDVPVTLYEAGSYPRHRVCGEFISGVSAETLEFLGIEDLFDGAKRHTTLCWHEGQNVIHRDALPEPAIGLSRYRLDQRLHQRVVELGGTVITHHRARPDSSAGHVWAAGRKARNGSWIGLKAHVRGLPMSADLEMHSGNNGYAGTAGVEDDWVNVCGLFKLDRSLKANGCDLLPAYLGAGGNTHLANQLRKAEWREHSFSAVAGFKLGKQPDEPGIFALGDADKMIPPFTGNGMAMAFQAAESVCLPLVAWSSGEISWQAAVNESRHALTKRFRTRVSAAMLFHNVLFTETGKSVLQALSASRLLPFKPMLSFVR